MRFSIDPDAQIEELREYLGPRFDLDTLQRHERALMDELDAAPSEEDLYRTSEMYLYDLTVFAVSGTKLPYLEMLASELPAPARLLDYGCGIGADGLLLLEAGYDVAFADFDNPSTRYLRWRLERRGLEAPVYDLDRDALPGGFDLAYAFDVIEHVPDPDAFLGAMEAQAARVLVNFLEPESGETTLHHELPVRRLLRRSAGHPLRRYALLHGRSHVVLYESRAATLAERARARLKVLAGGR